MNLLAEGVFLNDCFLDELGKDGVGLNELACFVLKVYGGISQLRELQFWHFDVVVRVDSNEGLLFI